MKTKLFLFIFFIMGVIPGILFAQFLQQGPKFTGTGSSGTLVYQGHSLAISADGNTAVEGAYGDSSNAGAFWVFIRINGIWQQQGPKLKGTGWAGLHPNQGFSVAISADGNTIVEGGYADNTDIGAVWVFTRNGGVWTQQGAKLVGTGAVGPALQGTSVSISGDGNTIIEGGYEDNSQTGAVWVFTRSGGVWTQQGQKLVGTGGSQFPAQGISAAISADGNTIIEGGYADLNIGAVWIFTKSGNVWSQQGTKLVGTGYVGQSGQGFSVGISADGNTVVEGGYDPNTYIGATWVFTRSNGIWSQQGPKLTGTGEVGNSAQGHSVALASDGNTIVVGGGFDNSLIGASWFFIRNGGVWSQQGSKLIGTGAAGNSAQGIAVAISGDGNTILEAGSLDSNYKGAIWAFARSNYRLVNSHNNLNKLIQGNQSTLDTIQVVTQDISSYYISSVKIAIDTIIYPVDGDLEISLLHVSNSDTVIYQNGGSGANFIGTILNDSAASLISNGTSPFTGNFKPYRPLSKFINADPAGAWILKVFDRNTGNSGTLKAWTLTLDLTPTPISVKNVSLEIPNKFSLMQNYPNPFNPSTKIKFGIPASAGNVYMRSVQLKVFDISGREVAALVNQDMKPGKYEVNFDGSKYSSGIYFYKLVVGDNTNNGSFTETRKMILVK